MTHHQFRRTLLAVLGLPESTPDPEGAILATVRKRLASAQPKPAETLTLAQQAAIAAVRKAAGLESNNV